MVIIIAILQKRELRAKSRNLPQITLLASNRSTFNPKSQFTFQFPSLNYIQS